MTYLELHQLSVIDKIKALTVGSADILHPLVTSFSLLGISDMSRDRLLEFSKHVF